MTEYQGEPLLADAVEAIAVERDDRGNRGLGRLRSPALRDARSRGRRDPARWRAPTTRIPLRTPGPPASVGDPYRLRGGGAAGANRRRVRARARDSDGRGPGPGTRRGGLRLRRPDAEPVDPALAGRPKRLWEPAAGDPEGRPGGGSLRSYRSELAAICEELAEYETAPPTPPRTSRLPPTSAWTNCGRRVADSPSTDRSCSTSGWVPSTTIWSTSPTSTETAPCRSRCWPPSPRRNRPSNGYKWLSNATSSASTGPGITARRRWVAGPLPRRLPGSLSAPYRSGSPSSPVGTPPWSPNHARIRSKRSTTWPGSPARESSWVSRG